MSPVATVPLASFAEVIALSGTFAVVTAKLFNLSVITALFAISPDTIVPVSYTHLTLPTKRIV